MKPVFTNVDSWTVLISPTDKKDWHIIRLSLINAAAATLKGNLLVIEPGSNPPTFWRKAPNVKATTNEDDGASGSKQPNRKAEAER